MGKNSEEDIDTFISEISKDINEDSKENPWIAREYWYISQSYSNLELKVKAEKYRKLSFRHLEEVAKLISDSAMRKDYMELPLIHRLMSGENLNLDIKNQNDKVVNEIPKQKELSIFSFCPECGFNNENKFKFCPQCGEGLS